MPAISRWLLLTLFLLAPQAIAESSTPKHLTLIFASNMPEIGAANHGSYPKLASLLEQTRQEAELNLFVFGGSSLGPSPLSSLDRGSHIIDILNTLEPDLMNVDKREFSYFEDELTLRSYEAAFPFISSNLYDPLTRGNLEGINSTVIVEKDDIRIGFISILDKNAVEEYLLQRVEVRDPQDLINQYVSQLEQQNVDLIALIYSREQPYYQSLLDKGNIDFALKISPYNKTPGSEDSTKANRRFTLSDLKTTLMLKLAWPAGSPENLSIKEIPVELNNYPDDTATALLIDEYNKRLNRLLSQPIGKLSHQLVSTRQAVRTRETAIGNFFADAMRIATHADVALINGGSIRGDRVYPPHTTLTRADIIRELPFRTHLSEVTISGANLLATLEHSVSDVERVNGRFLQVSGLSFSYSASLSPGQRVTAVKIQGADLKPEKSYKLAISDYLLNGGDGFTSLSESQKLHPITPNTPLLSDIVIREIQKQQTISPELESRIVRITP